MLENDAIQEAKHHSNFENAQLTKLLLEHITLRNQQVTLLKEEAEEFRRQLQYNKLAIGDLTQQIYTLSGDLEQAKAELEQAKSILESEHNSKIHVTSEMQSIIQNMKLLNENLEKEYAALQRYVRKVEEDRELQIQALTTAQITLNRLEQTLSVRVSKKLATFVRSLL